MWEGCYIKSKRCTKKDLKIHRAKYGGQFGRILSLKDPKAVKILTNKGEQVITKEELERDWKID